MAKIQRVTGKVFGGTATATGNDPQIGQFGSALANTYVGTTDISTIQQLPAWGQGFIGAVTTENQFPALPEMTGFGKVLSQQQCYILQQGMPEWDNETTYYIGGFCARESKIYYSLTDENKGNDPLTDNVNWQEYSSGGGLEIGDIGIAGLLIDETKGKRRYLNGSILAINSNTQAFVNKLKSAINLYPSLACTEEEWQNISTSSAFGQCGKFVIDDEAGTIRLPKITGFIQGLTDLTSLGDLVQAGLPNITASVDGAVAFASATGAFTLSNYANSPSIDNHPGYHGLNFVASRSSAVYGNSTTVQPESVRFPYFIQIATGVEEEVNITNTFETNIPYTLLDSVYSEYPKYNASMLLSAGQENPKGTYPDVYDALLIEQNSDIATGTTVTLTSGTSYTKRGLSVKNSTDADITDFDFVVNTANESFVLATKNGSEALIGDTQITVNTFTALGSTYIAPANGILCLEVTSTTAPATIQLTNQDSGEIQKRYVNTSGYSIKISIEAKKGQTIELSDLQNTSFVTCYFIPNVGNGPLYFYVGTTTQNDNIVNLGRVEEQIANINALPHIVETYQNGTSWYRVYSDGWCEQGGTMSASTFGTSVAQVTLLKAYRDVNYIVIGSKTVPDGSAVGLNCPIDKTTTAFTWSVAYPNALARGINWGAKGYIS